MSQSPASSDVLAFHTKESARVAVVSLRGAQREVWRALPFEFEDAIATLDSADIVGPGKVVHRTRTGERWVNARLRLSGGRGPAAASSRLPTTGRLYDLLFVPIGDFREMYLFDDLKPWLASSRLRVAWLVEVWSRAIPFNAGALKLLSQFDVIACGAENSVQALQEATGKPCFYLPVAVDAIKAMPHDLSAPRLLDVYQMGRRAQATHQALLDMARERNWYYLYDTSWNKETNDPVEHRHLLAETIKRTNFFIANRAKVDAPEQTGGQQEVGFRFFEGAAGGTIMIGEIPETPAYGELFGWQDAVIPMPFGSDTIVDLIDELMADPERMAAIRARNVHQALLRHDWAYRWRRILEVAGLKPMPGLLARERRLAELAERIVVPDAARTAAAAGDGGNVVRLQRSPGA